MIVRMMKYDIVLFAEYFTKEEVAIKAELIAKYWKA